MRNFITTIGLAVICLSAFSQNDVNNYYWYKGKKILLEQVENKKFILFDSYETPRELTESLNVEDLIVDQFGDLNVQTGLNINKTSQVFKKKWATINIPKNKNLNQHKNIFYHAPFYLTPENVEAGLSNLFYVKLKTSEDLIFLEKLARENNVEIVGNNKYMPLWFTLSCSKFSKGNALQMANYFYELGKFEAAQPDLMTDDSPFCVNDQHFNNQWNLSNVGQNGGTNGLDINFCDSRQITTGNPNIIVAVLDQGVELNHPDLTNIHSLSFDTESGTSPSQVLGNHGTACAGIIGANSDNTIGVTGIAPDSPIMSISNSLAGTPNSRQRRADGINFAVSNGASVISNSWGSAIQYQIIDDAINNALTNGRNGLGCVVVFASGNDNGAVSYPANANNDILVVGAMSPCGERKNPNSCDSENWGSNFGSQLDIVAPGVLIPTTDRQGSNGYNTQPGTAGNYTQNFNGTSSACPQIAAVAALILSVNPNLTSQEVSNILESTTQKVGGYNYTNNTNRSNGTWNNEMGYGLVDAYAAVQKAMKSIVISGPDSFCNINNITLSTNSLVGFQYTWSVTSNLQILSGQNTNSISVGYTTGSTGVGTVTLNLSNGNYSQMMYKNLYITPVITNFRFTGNNPGNPMTGEPLQAEVDPVLDAYFYEWYSDNNFLETTTDPFITTYDWECGDHRLYIRASTPCGYTDLNGPDNYYWGMCLYAYSYSPNPASSEIIIENSTIKEKRGQASILQTPSENKIKILVYDFNGRMVKTEVFNSSETSHCLDVSDLKVGHYFMKIYNGIREETHQIIISR